MTGSDLFWAVLKILLMFAFLVNVGGLLTWLDRRQGAMIQDRVGPHRAVLKIGNFELRIAGLLHTAADGVKFFFKEDFVPPNADKLLFAIAPVLAMAPVLTPARPRPPRQGSGRSLQPSRMPSSSSSRRSASCPRTLRAWCSTRRAWPVNGPRSGRRTSPRTRERGRRRGAAASPLLARRLA